MVVHWDPDRPDVADTAADYSDPGDSVAGCILAGGIGLGH